jgi:hypothetical protein
MVRNRYFYIPAVSKYLVTLKFTRQEALLWDTLLLAQFSIEIWLNYEENARF